MTIDLRRDDFAQRLRPAAEYICVNLHPARLRSRYVEHIRVSYKADLIVYALQELSTGMTALFLGLLANYLYDKYRRKSRDKQREADKLRKLIAQQEDNLKELQELIRAEKNKQFTREARQALKFHKETLLKVKANDSSIEISLKETAEIIKTKGRDALRKEVDSYRDHG